MRLWTLLAPLGSLPSGADVGATSRAWYEELRLAPVVAEALRDRGPRRGRRLVGRRAGARCCSTCRCRRRVGGRGGAACRCAVVERGSPTRSSARSCGSTAGTARSGSTASRGTDRSTGRRTRASGGVSARSRRSVQVDELEPRLAVEPVRVVPAVDPQERSDDRVGQPHVHEAQRQPVGLAADRRRQRQVQQQPDALRGAPGGRLVEPATAQRVGDGRREPELLEPRPARRADAGARRQRPQRSRAAPTCAAPPPARRRRSSSRPVRVAETQRQDGLDDGGPVAARPGRVGDDVDQPLDRRSRGRRRSPPAARRGPAPAGARAARPRATGRRVRRAAPPAGPRRRPHRTARGPPRTRASRRREARRASRARGSPRPSAGTRAPTAARASRASDRPRAPRPARARPPASGAPASSTRRAP